jgi:hypothetical protein
MPSVQYFTACTLDGFIADENHSLDWLFEAPHGDEDGGWDEFISGVGSMVMGATTYECVLQRHDMVNNPKQWHDFYEDRPCWVFTHRDLPLIPGVDIHLVWRGLPCRLFGRVALARQRQSMSVSAPTRSRSTPSPSTRSRAPGCRGGLDGAVELLDLVPFSFETFARSCGILHHATLLPLEEWTRFG